MSYSNKKDDFEGYDEDFDFSDDEFELSSDSGKNKKRSSSSSSSRKGRSKSIDEEKSVKDHQEVNQTPSKSIDSYDDYEDSFERLSPDQRVSTTETLTAREFDTVDNQFNTLSRNNQRESPTTESVKDTSVPNTPSTTRDLSSRTITAEENNVDQNDFELNNSLEYSPDHRKNSTDEVIQQLQNSVKMTNNGEQPSKSDELQESYFQDSADLGFLKVSYVSSTGLSSASTSLKMNTGEHNYLQFQDGSKEIRDSSTSGSVKSRKSEPSRIGSKPPKRNIVKLKKMKLKKEKNEDINNKKPEISAQKPRGLSQLNQPSVVVKPEISRNNVLNAHVLQKQLKTAYNKIEMYKKENEKLKKRVNIDEINQEFEKYKSKLLEQENKINELKNENFSLKQIAIQQSKSLFKKEQDKNKPEEHSFTYEKKIELAIMHLKKMKNEMQTMKEKENKLIEEKNMLKKKLIKAKVKNRKYMDILDAVHSASVVNQSYITNNNSGLIGITQSEFQNSEYLNLELQNSEKMEFQNSGIPVHEESSIDTFHTHEGLYDNSVMTGKNTGFGGNNSYLSQFSHVIGSELSNSIITALGSKHRSRYRGEFARQKIKLAENKELIQKQGQLINKLENSLSQQRLGFQSEINSLKKKIDEYMKERQELKQELEKRETHTKLQLSTIKQLRSTYTELQEGQRRLELASDLYKRDTESVVVETPVPEPSPPLERPKSTPRPNVRNLRVKAAMLSEDDNDNSTIEINKPRYMLPKQSTIIMNKEINLRKNQNKRDKGLNDNPGVTASQDRILPLINESTIKGKEKEKLGDLTFLTTENEN